jgi:pSer/pThr/pTyr-binding forkhead associated (FHA) protein
VDPGTRAGPALAVPPETGDGTLQLLPGRLEYADGSRDQDIRFVRSSEVERFTLGRSPGPTSAHIQILAATVSRTHAYMRFDGDRWVIGNLSRTNSARVNEVPLKRESERVLEEGDRIELGEVTLVFHAR